MQTCRQSSHIQRCKKARSQSVVCAAMPSVALQGPLGAGAEWSILYSPKPGMRGLGLAQPGDREAPMEQVTPLPRGTRYFTGCYTAEGPINLCRDPITRCGGREGDRHWCAQRIPLDAGWEVLLLEHPVGREGTGGGEQFCDHPWGSNTAGGPRAANYKGTLRNI